MREDFAHGCTDQAGLAVGGMLRVAAAENPRVTFVSSDFDTAGSVDKNQKWSPNCHGFGQRFSASLRKEARLTRDTSCRCWP